MYYKENVGHALLQRMKCSPKDCKQELAEITNLSGKTNEYDPSYMSSTEEG